MRQTGLKNSVTQAHSKASMSALRLAAIILGIGLVLITGPVHAGDDDDDEDGQQKTFERGILDNVMSSIGGKRIEDGTINYRERSPLVIPSKTDQLPPPASKKAQLAPNWPKDPDEAERKRAREEASKPTISPEQSSRPLMPSELATKSPRRAARDDNSSPGGNNSNSPLVMMPSELGYNGGMFSGVFGKEKPDTATFTEEPSRSELTEPPKGYQTPSPNFAYGTGTSTKAPTETCDAASGKCTKNW